MPCLPTGCPGAQPEAPPAGGTGLPFFLPFVVMCLAICLAAGAVALWWRQRRRARAAAAEAAQQQGGGGADLERASRARCSLGERAVPDAWAWESGPTPLRRRASHAGLPADRMPADLRLAAPPAARQTRRPAPRRICPRSPSSF